MKSLLLSTVALFALCGAASADVVVNNHLSGTGDNVIFNSVNGSIATALLNGQHTGTVLFSDLTGSTTFTAAANGNDIKIEGSQNLFIQVFDTNNTIVGTTTQVFSVTGTGELFAFVQANDINGNPEPIQAFDLTGLFGALGPGQNGFTFTATGGEVMTSLRILDVGGTITDFEHYRIDVAPAPSAVPGPVLGAGLPSLIMAAMGLFGFSRFRRKREDEGVVA